MGLKAVKEENHNSKVSLTKPIEVGIGDEEDFSQNSSDLSSDE